MEQKNKPSTTQNAVIYARYSSNNQDPQSIDIQVKACRAFAESNSYKIVDEYCDYAQTGRDSDREELQRLMKDSATGKFQVVLVKKVDRWFRDARECLNFIDDLQQNGVLFHSVEDGAFDTSNNRFNIEIKSVIAEHESNNIAERIRGGLKGKASKGLFLGGPPPFGYSVDRNTQKYVINKKEAVIIKKIFAMYSKGAGYTEILNYLNSMGYLTKNGNRFGANSLHDILKNEKYVGRYVYGKREYKKIKGKRHVVKKPPEQWTIIEDAIPAIIDVDTFNKVQVKLTENKKAAGRYKAKEAYLLSGVIKCGICDSPMHVNTRTDGYSSYNCSKKNDTVDCLNMGIRRKELDKYVVDQLYDKLFSSTSAKELAKLLNEHNEKMSAEAIGEIKLAKREVKAVEKEFDKLLDLRLNDKWDKKSANVRMGELKQKRRYAIKHLREMEQQHAISTIPEDMLLDLVVKSRKLLKAHNNEHAAERRNFVKGYVKKVIVYGNKVKVIFNIKEPETAQEAS